MSKKLVVKVHGKSATFEIYQVSHMISDRYSLYRNDKYISTYSSRADAVRKAHEEAGPGAYES